MEKALLIYLKVHNTKIYTAQEIAKDLNVNVKTVSGTFKKLINKGFVEPIEEKPKKYKITQKGLNFLMSKGEQ